MPYQKCTNIVLNIMVAVVLNKHAFFAHIRNWPAGNHGNRLRIIIVTLAPDSALESHLFGPVGWLGGGGGGGGG